MDANDIAAYVVGRLDAAARARIEAHLADCASCRADALAALRVRNRERVTWRWVAPALAAAAVLAVLVLPRAGRERAAPDQERGTRRAASVALASPDAGATVPATDLTLIWRASGPGANYRVTVTTEDGARVFDSSTRDTVLLVPVRSLGVATHYLWAVDAILSDGSVKTSGERGFVIRR